ncbi:MAG TPA: MM0924 family protein [Pyrinomonadaceae bacterium]|nr:MM0924 family protein [Pyrinomonadaceae bacterium]
MKEFLSKMVGRKVDVFCGGAASLRGEIVKVDGGVLYLKDEEGQMFYVAVEKIAVVWEAREDEKRAGFFVNSPLNNR